MFEDPASPWSGRASRGAAGGAPQIAAIAELGCSVAAVRESRRSALLPDGTFELSTFFLFLKSTPKRSINILFENVISDKSENEKKTERKKRTVRFQLQ